MQRPSAMHLPLDIYTLIGRYVGIPFTSSDRTTKGWSSSDRGCIYRPRESQYPGTSRNTIRFTSCTRRGGSRQGTSIYFPSRTARRGRGEPHKGFPSLSFRTHITQRPSPRLPFSTGNRARKSIQAREGRRGAIFRREGLQHLLWIWIQGVDGEY